MHEWNKYKRFVCSFRFISPLVNTFCRPSRCSNSIGYSLKKVKGQARIRVNGECNEQMHPLLQRIYGVSESRELIIRAGQEAFYERSRLERV